MAWVRSIRSVCAAAALAAAMALAGCGASPAGNAGAPSPPAMRLSTGDTGRSVTAQHGTTVEVSLAPVKGFQPWSAPVADNPSVLQSAGHAQAPGQGGATKASFKAAGDGSTRLTSHARVACSSSPGTACPMVVRSWTVTVKVTG